jgi:(1->4)-alpha-D-glucan 1-alpha-D-glucosylmutase
MRKATKEAKTHSSWVNENQAYEHALEAFVDATLRGAAARQFLAAFVPLQRRIARLGAINSLAQLALKLTAPGVVDLYQGTELWDLHLVDPDNRQPVDYAQRGAWLNELLPALPAQFWPQPPDAGGIARATGVAAPPLGGGSAEAADTASDTAGRANLPALVADLMTHWPDGRIKMLVLAALLRLRREAPALFLEGDYLPLRGLDEESGRHLIAFARRLGNRVAITLVPRLTSTLVGDASHWPLGFEAWKTMHVDLPDHLRVTEFRNVLTGATVRPLASGSERMLIAADVFKTIPIAVLIGDITPA